MCVLLRPTVAWVMMLLSKGLKGKRDEGEIRLVAHP